MKDELKNESDFQNVTEESKKKTLSYIKEAICYVILFVVCIFIIPRYVAQRTVVSGGSMNDTLYSKDNLIVEKLSYRFDNPSRYDIIIFYPFEGDDEYYVKRVIGLPGETIQIKDGMVYINGELLGEKFGKDIILDPGIAKEPITLGEDEYFVLGDNRNNSRDSRESDIGVVNKKQIKGHVLLRIWPLKHFGTVK